MSSSRVLITGGTGFIGSRLALACRAEGQGVTILAPCRTEAEQRNRQELEAEGVEVVDGSVTDRNAAQRATDGVETVYHLAAAQHEANVSDRYFHEVNAEGTRNMLEAAEAAAVERFVLGSTIGVYGLGDNGPVDDDAPLKPDNIYGITKLEGERVAHEHFDRIPIAIARISETYGPGDRRLLKLFKGIQQGRFFMIGPGRNLHHPVYIDDLIAGLKRAATAENAPGRTFVLAGPDAITTDQMVSDIAAAIDTKPCRLRVPLWPLMTAAVVMEGTLRPLGIQPPLHRRRMNFFVKSFRFSCDRAGEAVGYSPSINFDEGARRTAEWYREMGML